VINALGGSLAIGKSSYFKGKEVATGEIKLLRAGRSFLSLGGKRFPI